jgi:hypothetical protein
MPGRRCRCARRALRLSGRRAYRDYRYGVGAAAVGAAAVGAAAAAGAYNRGGCGYDAYGNWVRPNQVLSVLSGATPLA